MTLQAFTLSTSEITFWYQKNRTEWEKTEISLLGIGFENLIEKLLIEQQARTGETIPNDHEQYISFNLIAFLIEFLNISFLGATQRNFSELECSSLNNFHSCLLMTLQAFTLSTSEIAFRYQKNRTEWEKTEISRLDIVLKISLKNCSLNSKRELVKPFLTVMNDISHSISLISLIFA